MKLLSHADIRGIVQARLAESESMSACARALGVAKQALWTFLQRESQPVPRRVLKTLGYKAVMMYEKVQK